MYEKERMIKIIECSSSQSGAGECEQNDFVQCMCESGERLNYCIPLNCAECEFRTKCTYVYESF